MFFGEPLSRSAAETGSEEAVQARNRGRRKAHARRRRPQRTLSSQKLVRPWDFARQDRIVHDIAGGMYSDLQLAAFVTAGAGEAMDEHETLARLRWTCANARCCLPRS